jgi:ketosteroid isomerase-like protein
MQYKFVRLAVVAFVLSYLGQASPVLAQDSKEDESVKQAYRAYVDAWKNKDIPRLHKLIADDYMSMNSENKVDSKEGELATAKADPAWKQMTVDEIHTRIVGKTAVASGLLSAQGQRPDNSDFSVKVRFLAVLVKRDGRWQVLATESAKAK